MNGTLEHRPVVVVMTIGAELVIATKRQRESWRAEHIGHSVQQEHWFAQDRVFPRSASPPNDLGLYRATRPRDEPDAARTLFGLEDSGGSNSAAGATLNAVARTSRASKVGLAEPVSTRDM